MYYSLCGLLTTFDLARFIGLAELILSKERFAVELVIVLVLPPVLLLCGSVKINHHYYISNLAVKY